jgi:C4-dicarboxylate transporter DctM subunit
MIEICYPGLSRNHSRRWRQSIHFGIIMAVNLSTGMYTPPFGLNLFVSQAVFDRPIAAIYRGALPFVIINFLALLVITYVPAVSMILLDKH